MSAARTPAPAADPADSFDPALLDLGAPVIFFPVRHHSPACARFVREAIAATRPALILIEGPSDFNERIGELALPDRLPIAIYAHAALADGRRRGAFYPFCAYSPEWQALQAAAVAGIPARFIDLPWGALLARAGDPAEPVAQRYADGELRGTPWVETLCRRLGVDDFDDAWDTLFEIDDRLTLAAFLERCHRFCAQLRAADPRIRDEDLRREAFMAAAIREARDAGSCPILVVTGGFHSAALHRLVAAAATSGGDERVAPAPSRAVVEGGIALTPYSYERLDSLTGYESGMPHPGFYDRVWAGGVAGSSDVHVGLLGEVAETLRARGQAASAADSIAVEVTARGLAALRGHARVWRRDLVDGITGALVKDELVRGLRHPFLDAVYAVLRGEARGESAAGTAAPPLVDDLHARLREHEVEPTERERAVRLDLAAPRDLARSRLLHRVRGLGIAGVALAGGSDFLGRADLVAPWEEWRLHWTPDFAASAIEAALWGASVAEAGAARLLDRAGGAMPSAEAGALLLLDACRMGFDTLAGPFYARLAAAVRADGDFLSVSGALGHLLHLYRYDDILGAADDRRIGDLLAGAFARGLWLLDGLGDASGRESGAVGGVRALLETFERCAGRPGLAGAFDRAAFTGTLRRVAAERGQATAVRGAAAGSLWTLGEGDLGDVVAAMRAFAAPTALGDFLSGLFALAREAARRRPDLLLALDGIVAGYDDAQYLVALPALRLAFSFFTPREKHHLARTLLETTGGAPGEPLDLAVDPGGAARALALEARLFATIARYGLGAGA